MTIFDFMSESPFLTFFLLVITYAFIVDVIKAVKGKRDEREKED